MDLTRLPPSLLLALGLAACTEDKETSTSACLDVGPMTESSTGSMETSTSACLGVEPTTDVTTDITSGPCLDVTSGPCLAPEPTTGTETGTDTDTDTDGTSSSTGAADTGTTGNGLDAAPRAAVVDRLANHGILPPDVIARLRARNGNGHRR